MDLLENVYCLDRSLEFIDNDVEGFLKYNPSSLVDNVKKL